MFISFPRPALVPYGRLVVPKFGKLARRRIKELADKLQAMSLALADDGKQHTAFSSNNAMRNEAAERFAGKQEQRSGQQRGCHREEHRAGHHRHVQGLCGRYY